MENQNIISSAKYDRKYDDLSFSGNIALIGFMGTGKTTVCNALSHIYGMDVVDADADIERKTGMRINEIFEQYGEEHFRDLETQTLGSYEGRQNTVISCGGGAVLRHRNVEILKRISRVVLLSARPKTVLFRLKDDDTRPKLRGHKNTADIASMMAERETQYKNAADIIVDTDGKSIPEICKEILQNAARIQ